MVQRVMIRLTDNLDGTDIPAGKGETVPFRPCLTVSLLDHERRSSFVGIGDAFQRPRDLGYVDAVEVIEDMPSHAGQVARPRLLQAVQPGVGEDGVESATIILRPDPLDQAE